MIDTVSLLIPKRKMTYDNKNSNWDLSAKTEQYEKYVRNPNKLESCTGKYFPRLTGYRRRFGQPDNIKLEFSIPKLLYLNNLDEVEEADFNEVIDVLQERLKQMGIVVFKSILENAPVSSVHFSKNVVLKDGYTANYIISELNKINLRKSFDFAKTRFMNDGQSLYAHTTSHQLVIYDKIADINKGKKRAIDKASNNYQQNLFVGIDKKDVSEILRIEIRINHKQKLNKILTDLGYTKNPKFQDLFSNKMAKKIVWDYWEKIIKSGGYVIMSLEQSNVELLGNMLFKSKSIKPKQAIYLTGLILLGKNDKGLRQLRAIVAGKYSDRTWYRIAKDIKLASSLLNEGIVRDWVTMVEQQLKDFYPYRYKIISKKKNVKISK